MPCPAGLPSFTPALLHMRFKVSALERELVDEALRICAETPHQYSTLMPVSVGHHPVPFFGSLALAKVITLGLNPSTGEFSRHPKLADSSHPSGTDRAACQLLGRGDTRSSSVV